MLSLFKCSLKWWRSLCMEWNCEHLTKMHLTFCCFCFIFLLSFYSSILILIWNLLHVVKSAVKLKMNTTIHWNFFPIFCCRCRCFHCSLLQSPIWFVFLLFSSIVCMCMCVDLLLSIAIFLFTLSNHQHFSNIQND